MKPSSYYKSKKSNNANINRFEQAADVNSTILQKRKVQRKIQKELEALQKAQAKSKKYKERNSKSPTASQCESTQSQLSWGESSASSPSSDDTIILSDNESSPVLFEDSKQHIEDKETSSEEQNFGEGPK